ncbi:MAG: hypothetical protein LH481_13190 [Burkholderiales bacterium]|nr:hypothetical protein [Burkholderiales bacterium]
MESFVVGIYRRADAGPPTLIDALGSVASGQRRAFHNRTELVAMPDSDIVCIKPVARRVVAAQSATRVAK